METDEHWKAKTPPWKGHPSAPLIERLIVALRDNPLQYMPPRNVPGWKVGRSLALFKALELPRTHIDKHAAARVGWLSYTLDKDNYSAYRVRASRYRALFMTLYTHPELMGKLINDTARARMAIWRVALEGSDMHHFIALAKLYVRVTKDMPKEDGE